MLKVKLSLGHLNQNNNNKAKKDFRLWIADKVMQLHYTANETSLYIVDSISYSERGVIHDSRILRST